MAEGSVGTWATGYVAGWVGRCVMGGLPNASIFSPAPTSSYSFQVVVPEVTQCQHQPSAQLWLPQPSVWWGLGQHHVPGFACLCL